MTASRQTVWTGDPGKCKECAPAEAQPGYQTAPPAPSPFPQPTPAPYPAPAWGSDADALLDRFTLARYSAGPDQLIGARSTFEVYDGDIKGFLVRALLKTNNPNVEASICLKSGSFCVRLSPWELEDYGLVQPSPSYPWLSRYPSATGAEQVYVAVFTPSPWIPLNGPVRIEVANNSLEDAVFTLDVLVLERRW